MRELSSREKVKSFLERLGRLSELSTQLYLTGGASAVLNEWRDTTLDIDIKILPDPNAVLQLIPSLKEELNINIELASPSDFIPELPGWQERSIFIEQYGSLDVYHYDFYSQVLAKIERGHKKDINDVRMMLDSGILEKDKVLPFFDQIESELYRYPAIDPASFRNAVEVFFKNS